MGQKMKNSIVIILAVLLSCNLSTAQNQSTEPCNCEITFKDLIKKLESNYIALAQRQLSSPDKDYEARKNTYAAKSTKIKAQDCTAFLNDFLSFFGDGHLYVSEYPKYSESELNAFKQAVKQNKISEDSLNFMVQNDLGLNHSTADKILGQWTDGTSDFLVVKDKNAYKAYILKSTKEGIELGERKATFYPNSDSYEVYYNSYNYSQRYMRGGVYKEGTLFIAGNIMWIRKESSFERELDYINKADFRLPSIRKIDEKNTIISIPSFLVDAASFTSFLDKNEATIKNSENLIIDVRGNRGGNAIYFPLIKMYATNDMEGGQGLVLASPDNLAYFERQQKYAAKVFKPVVKRIVENQGKIVDGPLYPGKKFKVGKSKIKNVAILTDEAGASATESFILHSKKASTKVKTFGSPTDGMIDYTSVNSLLLESGKQNIYFGYPTSTLHKEIPKNGYNKTGIVPDIPIQSDVKDKLAFIMKYYLSH